MAQPKSIAKYKILKEIGRSDLAAVYEARDAESSRVVALKVFHPQLAAEPGFARRLREVMGAVTDLRHPNIAAVHEVGEAEDQLYVAMEYLPGRTLQALLEEEDSALPFERASSILRQMAEALDRAHAQDLLHLDLRPGNVMVEETEEGVRATLMGFGLAQAMEGSAALETEYLAPEQVDPERASEVGPAADRYALGAVAYRMLTGRAPFSGNASAAPEAQGRELVTPRSLRPDLPQSAEAALLKMLAQSPDDRFSSARAFAIQLREISLPEGRFQLLEARLLQLYKRLQVVVAEGDWAEALVLGGQIRELNPGYRDVPGLMAQARERLRSSWYRSVPTWGWGALAVLLLGGGWLLWGMSRREPGEPVALRATPVVTEDPTPAPAPTAIPTLVSTVAPAPTATPQTTPLQTLAATFTPSPVPFPTSDSEFKIDSWYYPAVTWEANPVSIPYVDGNEYRFWFNLRQRSAYPVEVQITQFDLVHVASGRRETGRWPRSGSQWYTIMPGEAVGDGFNVRTVHSAFLAPQDGEIREPGQYNLFLKFGCIRVEDRQECVGGEMSPLVITVYEP
ncbi:MAG: protein kinase [Chloroflexi bacterium]|nr:protein kinase [Chloroflexota bacterium]